MCSFLVYTGNDISQSLFLKGLNKINYRGPDNQRVLKEDGLWGFNRLAIMGLEDSGMQPFIDDKMKLVCNGEIYGFRKLKKELEEKGYKFKSASDCEILIPLYKEYGLEMFKMLDAEYACVLFDGKDYIAARDPIGIRPMFYGYSKKSHKIMFASEAKALLQLCSEVYPFPIGSFYYQGKFVCYNDVTKVDIKNELPLEEIFKNIHNLLIKGVEKRLDADAPVGFLLSGGLDSSLVCAIASKISKKPLKTFAIGMENDAIDLRYAKQVANYIKSDHTEVIISKSDIIKALDEVIYHLETYDITTIRASIGMYLLCKWIHKNTNIKVLLTGEVSDELFGYKYTDFAPSALEFQKESEKRIRELYMYDVLRADRCISGCSIEARVPFADLEFVKYVLSINPSQKMNIYNKGKYLLRKSFDETYLEKDILMREKAAFSDAVGHSLVDYLKDYAESMYTDLEFIEKSSKYKNPKPFTKESLLYREIFEKYYPNCSHFVVDYWMPNKSWPGCDVNDPSARVLSNYGNSGK